MSLTVDQPSIIFNRMLFHTRYQEENESVEDFAATLKSLLRVCQYAADSIFLDGLARDRFIAGVADKELQAFLTTQPESISLDEIVALCLKLQCPLNKDENLETAQILSNEYSTKGFNDEEPSIQNGNTHKCCFCDDKINDSSFEPQDISKQKSKKLYNCEKCEFSTGWKCSLRKHLENFHNNGEVNSKYVCDKCGFSTKFSRAYKKHLMSLRISGKCDIFDTNQNPDKYKQNEPIKCPHCDYTRTQRSKIVNHIKSVHEDEKPFKCSQCKSSFKLKFRLTAHMKLSHGDGKVRIVF